ncbi:helix-turn-helix domain-containing protein [Roseimarinus sediminis]|uniref:helix-turn-helix domain-containing protein n=1 Tax=Roseimarinus sediminis TaxID=1610899 RepID=UPI003D1A7036
MNSFSLINEEKLDKLFEMLNSLKGSLEAEQVKNAKKLSETWLDNQEVMDLLRISQRTLQSMRDQLILPYSKVGGKIYYKASDVEQLLHNNYHGK